MSPFPTVQATIARPFGRHFWGIGEVPAGLWMGAAFCASLGLAIAVLVAMGTHEKSVSMALRLTARLSFLFFWPAYVGGAIATLFGRRFIILARHGREFGLAFASAQLVHVGLVVWLSVNSPGPILERVMPFFAVGVTWTYILALSSLKRFQQTFSLNFSRILRNLGVEYIALVFYVDFIVGSSQNLVKHPIAYVPFSLLLIFGSLLRVTAVAQRRFTLTNNAMK